MPRKKILAISGSTRKNSSNAALLKTISGMLPDFEFHFYEGVDQLPHFNPDLDIDPAPEAVAHFRQLLKEADGVLICTPEYAMGVPGSLKNALDWTVSSADFSKKPTGLVTASSVGEKAHASLLETLSIIEAKLDAKAQLLIAHVKAKIAPDGSFKNEATEEQVKQFAAGFFALLADA